MHILKIQRSSYECFFSDENELINSSPDLSRLTGENILNQAGTKASTIFSEEIQSVRSTVSDPAVGVAALDIPVSPKLSDTENAFWGCAVALSIAKNIFTPQLDMLNDTPFTIYAASSKNAAKLAAAGLAPMSPETKLGFHTDGTVTNGVVSIPRHIMLYNIAIEYELPGCFHWIPFKTWSDKLRFVEAFGLETKYKISPTASVYQNSNGDMKNVLPTEVQVPIFFKNTNDEVAMYLNGDVKCRVDGKKLSANMMDSIRESLQRERNRYSIPQRTRRAIFAANMYGAHARDIFESARKNVPFSRILMRSVDSNTYAI